MAELAEGYLNSLCPPFYMTVTILPAKGPLFYGKLIYEKCVVLLVEFIIAVGLFSLVSFVTSGYQLTPIYSSDPNSTVVEKSLRGVPDFLTTKSKPSCQSLEVAVGETFSTNNSALTYQINRIEQAGGLVPSIAYHRHPFTSCEIRDVLILIDTDRNAAQLAWMNYGADLSASITCDVFPDGNLTTLDFSASYTYVPRTVTIHDGLTEFPGRDKVGKASLFWGEELLAFYWTVMVNTYRNDFVQNKITGDLVYTKAALYLTKNPLESDITARGFFLAIERLYATQSDNSPYTLFTDLPTPPIEVDNKSQPFWPSADALTKVFYSTIMTDLGQQFGDNILTDPILLQNFSAAIPRFRSTLNGTNSHNAELLLDRPERVTGDYNSVGKDDGPLGIKPAVISARYLCQVPRLKSTGNLIVSFLITNLVLLQTLWAVTIWVATWLTNRRDRNASFCMRCEPTQVPDEIQLRSNPKKSFTALVPEQEHEEFHALISPPAKHQP